MGTAGPSDGGGGPIDSFNVQDFVTDEMCDAVLLITPQTESRIKIQQIIHWPSDCADGVLKTKEWESKWLEYNDADNSGQLRGMNKTTVVRTFVKLLIAFYQQNRQVSFTSRKSILKHKRRLSVPAPSPSKRPNIAGNAPPQPPNLTAVGTRMGVGLGGGVPSLQGGDDLWKLMPSILRNSIAGEGRPLDYMGSEFKMAPGVGPGDVATDFQNLQQMLNSLNPLLPVENQHQHPIYTFQGKMNVALELLKSKCKSVAASNEQMMNSRVLPASPEILNPKLDQIQSSVLEAVQGLQSMMEARAGGSGETVELMREIERLREQNGQYQRAFERQRSRADDFERALARERQKAARYTNLERLNHMQEAGFIVNDRFDPPAATLEACSLVVMNKTHQYWTEFDQDRWGEMTHQQKKDVFYGWDPTNPAVPHPQWASYDKQCPICGVTIGPEGGYSTGTCALCIYHPGCLQEFLLSGTRLECASCGVRFNLRLWQLFKCTQYYTALMPEIGPDGKELPKRTQDMTPEEFQEWFQKDQAMIIGTVQVMNKLIPNRNSNVDANFITVFNVNVPKYINSHRQQWGLIRQEWADDLLLNLRAICLPEVEGVDMPPFPDILRESGILDHPQYPASFWRPPPDPGAGGAGPANA